MAIALPTRTVKSIRDTSTAAATTTYNFTIPQDANGIVAKVWLASTWSAAAGSADIYLQTSDDAGTTWRDCAHLTVGSGVTAATVANNNAHFIPIPVIGNTGIGIANYIGSVCASSFGIASVAAKVNGVVTGLPLLGQIARVQITYNGTISTGGLNIDILAPSQDSAI